MSGQSTRDRDVIVDRSSRENSSAMVGFAIIMFNQGGNRGGAPAGGGGTTTEQPKDTPTAAPAAS